MFIVVSIAIRNNFFSSFPLSSKTFILIVGSDAFSSQSYLMNKKGNIFKRLTSRLKPSRSDDDDFNQGESCCTS